jgi:hypothetical protein
MAESPRDVSAFSPHHLPDMDAKRRIVGSINYVHHKATASTFFIAALITCITLFTR